MTDITAKQQQTPTATLILELAGNDEAKLKQIIRLHTVETTQYVQYRFEDGSVIIRPSPAPVPRPKPQTTGPDAA